MIKMASQIENMINAYKTLSKIPSVLGGRLIKHGTKISSRWSVKNLDKGKNTKFLYNYVLNDSFNVIAESEFGIDISTEVLSSVSPRETFKAVIREEKDKDVKKQYLEVWRKNRLLHSINLTALDLHGDVYADPEFGGLDWSPDESAVLYVAEKKLPKPEPYIKRKPEERPQCNGGTCETAPNNKGEEFLYRQDWGEQLVGKHLSVVVVCQLETEKVSVLGGLPETWCPGQVVFAPDGESVVGVAWETEPRRLGLKFCTNRPSYIFSLTNDGTMKKLSSEGMAVRSPRFSPEGDLVWLQRTTGGPHHACHALVMMKKGQSEVSTIIDIVDTEIQIANGSFHGLYCQALPERCFVDNKRVLFSTPQQTEVRSYVVNLESKHIVDISNRTTPGSTSVLDIQSNVVLAVCSNMTTPGQLFVSRMPTAGTEADARWVRVSEAADVPLSLATSSVQYLQLTHENSEDSVKSFTAIYMAPQKEGKLPLVVWPHGGPHSGFVNAFASEAAFFAMLGFAMLQINYRGSTGGGQASVGFLPKRVGSADVVDCKLATDIALKQFPIDENKLCLVGGSHGGFLVTHLSGQYPDLYKVVATRNPVTDVATMFNSTDIADWCAVEAGFEFTEKGPVSEEHMLAMRRCSPIAHVHKVKAPTAMMLGSGDKRVPLFQGLEYARRLKANGVTTRIYMYDDNHSLSSPAAEMDHVINTASWFFQHLS
ncbi:acylamino-acid-releasing enzyme-like isoform X1 [Ostrinia furnacalis]|uniref:acylamino-acid-releasing enzyme-like isoform X1 n=1 Tax=Ostrinia furnacalis TaxID=93504 RepID=UPI00103954AB|nr:acylamino-acid-releasing enzyme-like isoform X1 [Ostrinia furnacalis]XP_028174257.1 acylamino-acid-releasing enzyme-like isoform X2 [Ostrinia furnacalis]XP_028174264.1 acylamino-acid-releasing enzyme-like isoform X3 [Ostrinia furnacalis]XP_028174273.1 acylamino-acid-releasing enzyme-like isoform X4 [Ostrinia furnacalis]XP_028174282.1 acylamino-acid-releasing enzyme-like isoform X1 [Ostrinia furnacalis]